MPMRVPDSYLVAIGVDRATRTRVAVASDRIGTENGEFT
jgi:hypothetical protein